MPIDGITLGFIAKELTACLAGGRVDRIQQPDKDEMVITLRAGGQNRRLLLNAGPNHARAHLTQGAVKGPDTPPMFCMLLRKHLGGAHFLHAEQDRGDRVLDFWFECIDELGDRCRKRLVLEVMGRHSNLALVDGDGRIAECMRRVTADVSSVRQMLPGLPYRRPPEQGKLDPGHATAEALAGRLSETAGKKIKGALMQTVAGLSPQLGEELAFRLTGDADAVLRPEDVPTLSEKLAALLSRLPLLLRPTILLDGDAPLDVTPFPYLLRDPAAQREMPTLSQAMDFCFREREARERLQQKRGALERALKSAQEKAEKKLALHLEAQRAAQGMEQLRIHGDLLLSSLHLVERGRETAVVPDYFSEDLRPVSIPLDPSLSPMENVQRYYKRYGRVKAAATLAEGQLRQDRQEMELLSEQMENLSKCQTDEDLAELRQELSSLGLIRPAPGAPGKKAQPASRPMRYRSSDGTDIYVGKNNTQNDRLTFSAGADETWLHAKDMPGSHVIVRSAHPSRATLYEAAVLAAHFSRGTRSANVPVDYTKRKFVKKPSGSRPGYVTYTDQTTLFVTPDEAALKIPQRIED